jgi:hypothetical protein
MSEFTKIWDQLGRTDPAHTSQFKRGGGFSGTAIKPIWSFRRMTEMFGPCGIGWGVSEPTFQVVPGHEGEVLVYCTAAIWYAQGEEQSRTVYGVGGDKVVAKNKYGLNGNDEAFKAAYTDALTNALKLIGVGADVHMGRFDDNKYVRAMQEEFSEPPALKNAKREVGWSKDGTERTAYSLRKEKVWDEFQAELLECKSPHMVTKLALAWAAKVDADKWPETWKDLLRDELHKRMIVVKNLPAPDDDAFPDAEIEASAIDQRMRDERAALAQHPIRAG